MHYSAGVDATAQAYPAPLLVMECPRRSWQLIPEMNPAHRAPRSYRHGARNQPGNTGHHHAAVRPIRGGDTKHQARGRDDAVIGTQYGRGQPADAVRAVPFQVAHGYTQTSLCCGNAWPLVTG